MPGFATTHHEFRDLDGTLREKCGLAVTLRRDIAGPNDPFRTTSRRSVTATGADLNYFGSNHFA